MAHVVRHWIGFIYVTALFQCDSEKESLKYELGNDGDKPYEKFH